MRSALFFLMVLVPLANTTTTKTKIETLPGLTAGSPATNHYSGFVEVDQNAGSHLFYYYVEAETSPETAPLVFWMNGGPGASSLVGLFAEVGPYILTTETVGEGGGEGGDHTTPKLMPNPYSWNKHANLLFVEFGEGIGYSYCRNSSASSTGNATDSGSSSCKQSSPDCSPCPSSDSRVARHNAAFLESFLGGPDSLFPELSGRPLYLTGEVHCSHCLTTTPSTVYTLTVTVWHLSIGIITVRTNHSTSAAAD
jgi:hypothetical protein